MADTQSTIYGQAYSRNIMQLAQQKYSKLINTVYLKPNVKGKNFYQDQIGQWSMEAKAARNAATPNNDPTLARRMGSMIDYHDNRMLDRGDELRTISDPRSAYTIAAAQSLGRQIDDVIIDAMEGTAYSGETGSTSVTLGTTNIVSVSTTGLTLVKVLQAKRKLDDNDIEMEDRFFVISPQGLEDLLDVTEATSSDYNSVKALMRGEIDTWMGFKWITSTRLNELASTTRSCLAYQKYGLCLAMGSAPLVRTDERTDLSYSWQVYYELNIGAVRLEEKRVVRVDIVEE
jgi:hypothetical protein